MKTFVPRPTFATLSLLSCFLALQLLAATAVIADPPSPTPLLPNGDFEADANADGWPDGWPRGRGGASWVEESGNHFLRLRATAPGQLIMLYQPVPIPATVKAVELTWLMRVSDLKKGKQAWFDARIMMDFKDAAGSKLKGAPAPNTGKSTDGWVERSVQFLVPDGARTLDFMPTLFQAESGTFDLDDVVLRPIDPAPLLAAAQEKLDAARRTYPVPEAPRRERWPQELRVEGRRVLTKAGQEIWLQGVNIVSLEWSVKGEQVQRSALVAIEDWRANIIRVPVKEDFWFGKGANDGGGGYRATVDAVIAAAANRGAYVLLDLHRFRAPQAEHVVFWKDAAARYRDHPAVLFDLFNEPHGTTWEVWRNGGWVEQKRKAGDEDAFTTAEEKTKASAGFQAVGMQALLDAVRVTRARNVVLAGGLDYAYDLSGITNGYALEEKGGNGIIYSTHIYPWKKGWAAKVLPVAEKHPVLVGEVGASTKKMTFIPAEQQEDAATWVPAMLGFIQKHHLHWTAFSFHPKAAPAMLSGWDYSPTPEWGLPAKQALGGESFELDRLR